MKATATIINELTEYLKKNDIQITEKITLQVELLRETIITYRQAIKEVENNGIVIYTNGGKTFCQNPAVKIKIDTTKLIIRLINEITKSISDDTENVDDFIARLCGERDDE